MSWTVQFHTSKQVTNWLNSTEEAIGLTYSFGVPTKQVVSGVTGEVALGLEEVFIAAFNFTMKWSFNRITT
jgi:hypothetical protein